MPRSKEQFKKIREDTKNRILNSALELFARNGYTNTSISDIANSAGISKGLAYNYFESKQSIIESVIEILFLEIGNMFEGLKEIKNPTEKLQKIIDYTFEMLKENGDYWRLYTSLLMQAETKTTVEAIAGNFMGDAFKELEKIFRKLKIKNPRAEAKVFGAILDGMSFHILFLGDEYPIERMKKFLINKYI